MKTPRVRAIERALRARERVSHDSSAAHSHFSALPVPYQTGSEKVSLAAARAYIFKKLILKKHHFFRPPSWTLLGDLFGALWGPFWSLLAPLWRSLGASGALLGAFWGS